MSESCVPGSLGSPICAEVTSPYVLNVLWVVRHFEDASAELHVVSLVTSPISQVAWVVGDGARGALEQVDAVRLLVLFADVAVVGS